jgi:hypothetical protein
VRVLLPALALLVVFVAGYLLGQRGRREAVAASYTAVLPVLQSTRQLLAEDPLSPAFTATRAVAQHALDAYETDVRAL